MGRQASFTAPTTIGESRRYDLETVTAQKRGGYAICPERDVCGGQAPIKTRGENPTTGSAWDLRSSTAGKKGRRSGKKGALYLVGLVTVKRSTNKAKEGARNASCSRF